MKQYVIKEAYTDNYTVTRYLDGRLEGGKILSIWDLSGYLQAIENDGYIRAYVVGDYIRKLQEAEAQYNYALNEYQMALQNPLWLSEEAAETILFWEGINGTS